MPSNFCRLTFTFIEFYGRNSCSWIRPEFIFSKNQFWSVYVAFSQGFTGSTRMLTAFWMLNCRFSQNGKADCRDTAADILLFSGVELSASASCPIDVWYHWYNRTYCRYRGWTAGWGRSNGHLGYGGRSWCTSSTTSPS